ncbi:putative membrane protein [Methylobacterium sp. BE186]|uniref:hypothetical protein n=1 Tax=Methylobacterium sp. BE186 TaxID=2817715 RepID=UPI00285D601A|nr:hypothetical protein [Methylobacterium sp. BE186]MDR7039879.1 putative membrane protein [Methylobacterium sp. BE186]
MLIPALFAVFGALCGLWLSVVGVAFTTLGLIVVCGLASYVFNGPLTPLLLLGCALSLQVGYVLTVALRSLVLHMRRVRAAGKPVRKDQAPTKLPSEQR